MANVYSKDNDGDDGDGDSGDGVDDDDDIIRVYKSFHRQQ